MAKNSKGNGYGGLGRGAAGVGNKAVVMLEVEGKPGDRGDGNPCIAWDREGQQLIATTSHALIFFHAWPPPPPSSSTAASPLVPSRRLSHHRSSITSLALSPSGLTFASGSLDHSVKLFSYPDGEFQSTVTRFTLPIHAVAFSSTGSLLAAAGEDDGIKIISTIDSSIVRVLKGHNAPIISLAFDPNNEFLASAGSDGTIMCWCLSSGKRVHTLYHAAPNTDLNNSGRNEIAWHPKGDVLAVPGRKNGVDVVMYDRDTGEKVFSLKGGHSATVGSLAWSQNGKYLATAAGDNQVIIWDVDNRQDIDCQKFEAQICSLAWRPKGNALAVVDSDGKFGVWEPVVPSHMTLPGNDASLPSVIDREELLHFSDDGEDGEQLYSEEEGGSPPERGPNSPSEPDFRKKEKRKGHGNLQQSLSSKPEALLQNKNISLSSGATIGGHLLMPALQTPFQPCSTQPSSGKRHFLSYNLIGSITSCQTEELSHIEVEFHDTGKGVRVPSMTDYFGFKMAAMNDNGCVFASHRNGEKNPSTILYRPFSSWANNSEWSMRLAAEEEARALALGCGWVAVSTSLNHLRLFSEGGLQTSLLSLAGPVVTMAGHKELLAIVLHAGSPLSCDQQVMQVTILNVAERRKVMEGPLPLSPSSHLGWLGFSDTGFLSSYDSKGQLRVYTSQYGGSWIPVFSASKELKSENESLWMVGLNNTQVFCIICKLPDKQPQVSPKPILSVFDFSLPMAHSDLGADDLENKYLLGSWQLVQMADELASKIEDDDLDEEILKIEADLDRCTLRLIAAACKADKLVKAVELTKRLTLDKSWKGAIKLVTAMRLPALAERLSALYEERMLQEASQSQLIQGTEQSGMEHDATAASLSFENAKPFSASLLKSPAPNDDNTTSYQNGHASHDKIVPAKMETEEGDPPVKLSTAALKSAVAEQTSMAAEQDAPSSLPAKEPSVQRSNNPFAKSSPVSLSSGQSGGSILQSFKRIRATDMETQGGANNAKLSKKATKAAT